MLLIAAALGEELDAALRLFPVRSKSKTAGVALWSSTHSDGTIVFLKTGMGPGRAARRIEKILQEVQPSTILVIGYAGALDGRLKVGDILIVQRAMPLGSQKHRDPQTAALGPNGGSELHLWQDLYSAGCAAGLEINLGNLLTSSHIVGDPERKNLLFHQFGARAVDMETAAIAAVAAFHGIPVGCVRAISDTAQDGFLAPFDGDPSSGFFGRAAKLVSAENLASAYRTWRESAVIAQKSLNLFLAAYLQHVRVIAGSPISDKEGI